MEATKKKRHVGRTILIILLAIIVLIPVCIYCYLRFGGWNPKTMHAADALDAPYNGTAEFCADGVVNVPLSGDDVYWLSGQYDVRAALEEEGFGNLVEAYAFGLEKDGVTLYVDAKLLGFLPVPLKISTDATCSGDSIDLTIREVRLGKLIGIPLDKLAAFDVPETLSIDLDEIVENSKITDIVFEQGYAVVSEQFMGEFMPEALAAVRRCGVMQALYLYYGDAVLEREPLLGQLLGTVPAHNGADTDAGTLAAAVAASDDPARALQTLFSLCTEKEAAALAETCDDFERHFILGGLPERAAEGRAENIRQLIEAQTVYEGLLTALRTKYQNLELTIDATQFVDHATGAPLVLSSLAPDAHVDDAESRAVIIYSYDAFNAVRTFDMPLLKDVPCKNKAAIAGVYAQLRYDLCIVLRLPCGLPACLYYQGDGQFVVNCLDEASAHKLLTQKYLPVILSDDLPRPATRTRQPALAEGLSDYALLVPESVA